MANKTAAELLKDEQLAAELKRVANQLSSEDLHNFRIVTDWQSEEEITTLPAETVESYYMVVRLCYPLLSRLAIQE